MKLNILENLLPAPVSSPDMSATTNVKVASRRSSVLSLVFLLFPAFLFSQTDTLRLIFAGDIMGHAPQIKSAEVVAGKKYDYTPCFKYVKPILDRADLAIGNLELTLPGKPPYNGYPMFRSPDDLLTMLPPGLPDPFTTADLARQLGRTRHLAQEVAYCLRESGALQVVSRGRNGHQYRRP